MKSPKLLLVPVLVFGLNAGGMAAPTHGHSGGHFDGHAHGHFHGHGVFFGGFFAAPLFYPYYYNPYPYYPAQAPVYVEQGDSQAGQGGYWYHCDNPPGYFPYVKECPNGWHQVIPTRPPY